MHRLERSRKRGLKYSFSLAALHEDMHAEAFHYTRQTPAYANPYPMPLEVDSGSATTVDIEIAGGAFLLGANDATGSCSTMKMGT